MSNIPLNVNTVDWDVTASKVIGRLNSNLIFDVSGTSNIIFRSNNFNRLLITDTSNIDISGTAMRFRGDFSNATIANRLCFQSSITNGTSGLLVIPNGTATTGAFVVKNDSNADNGVQSGISQTSGTSFLILGSPTGSTVSGTNASIIVGGLGGVETINATTGIHTFNTAIPECSIAPTTSNQLVNKTYVDNVGTFTTYTPSNTNVTVGNGTQTARYSIVGKTVFLSYRLIFGSTTSFGNPVAIGLPFTSNSFSAGLCYMTDIGVTNYTAQVVIDPAATQTLPRPMSISGSYPRYDAALNSTTPFTWGTGDILAFSVTYESV